MYVNLCICRIIFCTLYKNFFLNGKFLQKIENYSFLFYYDNWFEKNETFLGIKCIFVD